MKLREVLRGIPLMGETPDLEMEINSISYDTRTLRPGGLFVAIPGEKQDGADFIPQAEAAGAAAILSQRPPETPGCWFQVEDARAALAVISANWYGWPGEELVLVGVTGTNGKTTTTNLIKSMLEDVLATKVGLIGTNRNMIGALELPAHRTTPESWELQGLLRRMADAGCTHVVMEVSSHALVQHRVDGLVFQVGVFTNLTQDHLDYHGTMENYRAAKGRLFAQSRRAVVNLDDEAGRFYARTLGAEAFTYSENKDAAALTAKNIRLFPGHVEFEAVIPGQICRIHLPIPGGFTIYNALAALSAGLCLGLRLEEMAVALRCARGVKGRVEVVSVPTAYTVLIDYAHTPNALENILTTARDFTAGRLICVFGCGGDRDRAKRPLMGGVVGVLADVAVVTSDNPRSEPPGAIIDEILAGMGGCQAQIHVEPDRPAAIGWALGQGRPGDVIVLAGKGHETYQEICGVKYPLDEREVVARWFENRDRRREKAGNIPAGIV